MVLQELKRLSAPAGKKEQIAQKLEQCLEAKPEVLFACLYGSFLEGAFRDIDIGIFLDEKRVPPEQQLQYQLGLLEELSPLVNYSLDVRVFNRAPLAFRYNVTRGRLLFTRDEEVSNKFIEHTRLEYFDFQPVIEKYLEEFARG